MIQLHTMYRKRDDLDNLIKAMSGGEKRYFYGFSSAFTAQGEDPLYMQLFRLLENQESEHQAIFPAAIKRSLSKTKERLYGNILKSLRLFHQEKSVSIIIQNLLCEVEVLYNLSLAAQSLLLLDRAYQLAVTYEKFGLLLQILEWESRLNVVLDQPTRSQQQIIAEEALVLEKQRQFRFLENIFVQAEMFKRKHGFVKGSLRKELETATVKAPGMPALSGCLSQKAVFYFNFIYALYYWMTLDHDRAFYFSQRLTNPATFSLPPGDYISGLLEHITSCVCLMRFKDAMHGIQVCDRFVKDEKLMQSPAFAGRMFAYRSTCELVMYSYMGDRKALLATIEWTEQELKQFQSLPFENRQVIVGNLMNAYMALGNMTKADQIWDSMFNKQSQSIRRDIYADLHLFRLFSLLTTKNYSVLPSAAAAALRYFRKATDAKNLFEVELSVATALSKERDYNKAGTLEEIIAEIKKTVCDFIKQVSTNGFQEHFSRYQIWCDAIVNDEPFYKAAARWHKGETYDL